MNLKNADNLIEKMNVSTSSVIINQYQNNNKLINKKN